MKLLFLILGTFGSHDLAVKKTWIFLRSSRRFGAEPTFYGDDLTYWPGYRSQKVDHALAFLEKVKGDYTHVFYTDACDCLMLGPLSEVEEKYREYGAPPILVSSTSQLGNVSDNRYDGVFDTSAGPFCYPHCGGYIAEIPVMINVFQTFISKYPQHGDDCFMWYDGYRDGWFRPVIDTRCGIWHVNATSQIRLAGNRVKNAVTGEYPVILHLSGGYSDPDYVRDTTMLPWAYDLGVVPRGMTRDDVYPELKGEK